MFPCRLGPASDLNQTLQSPFPVKSDRKPSYSSSPVVWIKQSGRVLQAPYYGNTKTLPSFTSRRGLLMFSLLLSVFCRFNAYLSNSSKDRFFWFSFCFNACYFSLSFLNILAQLPVSKLVHLLKPMRSYNIVSCFLLKSCHLSQWKEEANAFIVDY